MITGLNCRVWYWNKNFQQWRMDEVDQIDMVNETVTVLKDTVVDLNEAHIMRSTDQTDLHGVRIYEGDLVLSHTHVDKHKASETRRTTNDHIAQVVWNWCNGWVLMDLEEDMFPSPLGAFDIVVGNEFQGILKEVDTRIAV